MFDIENEIKNWKKTLRKNPSLEDGNIEELESHLRDKIENFLNKGMNEEDAFEKAKEEIGVVEKIGIEFFKSATTNKISGRPSWKNPPWIPSLLFNYLKITIRNLKRNRAYSLINIAGLTIGLTGAIFILLWVSDELSYDKFQANYNNIYRVVEKQNFANGTSQLAAITPGPLSGYLASNYPEIKYSVRYDKQIAILNVGDKYFRENVAFADPDFLKIFSFKLLAGDKNNCLSTPNSVLLSESASKKYFDNVNPIGKVLRLNNEENLTVTGVLQNVPSNSHLKFDVVISFNILDKDPQMSENWGNNLIFTYILLNGKTSLSAISEKVYGIVKKNNPGSIVDLFLQPFSDIYLQKGAEYKYDLAGFGNIMYVNIFSIVAIFILLIACINFMNLSTARSAKRSKEIGLRKVVGSSRLQIARQFIFESLITVLLSLLLSFFIVELLLRWFNQFSGKEIEVSNLAPEIILEIIGLTILTSILAGIYPAIYLSKIQPVKILKEKFLSINSGINLRKLLVILQFTLSIALIISTLIVRNQMDFIQNTDIGFNKENIIECPASLSQLNKQKLIKNKLTENPDILSVSFATTDFLDMQTSTGGIDWPGKKPEDAISIYFAGVDPDFKKTFEIKMLKGRFLTQNNVSDSTAVVVNEQAAYAFGFDDPVGKTINMWGNTFTIIGVVKDFHFQKFTTAIEPMIFRFFKDWNHSMFIRISGRKINSTINYISRSLNSIDSESPFEYKFWDEEFNNLYKSETKMADLLGGFSLVAILISCLGLFGLAAYMAETKKKEIGIRKTLGASVFSIVTLQSKEFTKWVMIANIFAWPIAYIAMEKWLSGFAYRIEIGIWLFIISGLAAFVIAILTIGYQAIKSALTNPVNSLKYE